MRLTVLKFTLMVLMISGLLACGQEEIVVKEPVPRPVKTIIIDDGLMTGSRNFPGRIDAFQRAQVSFRVSGKLIKMLVNEGDEVKKGDLLAKLDPTDFQITLNNRQATYNKTKADFTRGKELVKDGYISRSQFDKMQADFTSAKSNLNKAKQDLKYTQLTAAFSGVIGKRYVQNFEEIQAKQEIFNLNDISQVEVKVDIPESLIQVDQHSVDAFASFANNVDKQYPLTFKEIAKTADTQTQTFELTLLMPQPDDIRLLPGMTTNVRIVANASAAQASYHLLPISAVKGASDMTPTIFIVDPETSTLKAKAVKVAAMSGSNIQVIEGVDAGDRIVVAGIAFMNDGEKVTLMPEVEQADPATAP